MNDNEALTTIRRSAHTLKGSGRMVGLTDMGEAAWALEQTLNLWLRQDMTATPELLNLIGDAHQLFSRWVAAPDWPEGAGSLNCSTVESPSSATNDAD